MRLLTDKCRASKTWLCADATRDRIDYEQGTPSLEDEITNPINWLQVRLSGPQTREGCERESLRTGAGHRQQ